MTVRLTLRVTPDAPLEAEMICPDRLAGLSAAEISHLPLWHGKDKVPLGDFFAVSGADGSDLQVEGDLDRVKLLGAGMGSGRLRIVGSAGMHVAAGMRGGEVQVDGDVGEWAGAEMRGGRLVIRGHAGAHLGAAYAGSPLGMRGGEIIVHGDAGPQAGRGMRRGLIAAGGRCAAFAGARLLAGTIVALGGLGPRAGAGMRRGTIVSMGPTPILPTFAFGCVYRPPFLPLYLRHLRALGLPVADVHLTGRYARWSGDGVDLRRGEILIWQAAG